MWREPWFQQEVLGSIPSRGFFLFSKFFLSLWQEQVALVAPSRAVPPQGGTNGVTLRCLPVYPSSCPWTTPPPLLFPPPTIFFFALAFFGGHLDVSCHFEYFLILVKIFFNPPKKFHAHHTHPAVGEAMCNTMLPSTLVLASTRPPFPLLLLGKQYLHFHTGNKRQSKRPEKQQLFALCLRLEIWVLGAPPPTKTAKVGVCGKYFQQTSPK